CRIWYAERPRFLPLCFETARRAMSAIGTKQTFFSNPEMSAFGETAGIAFERQNVCFLTQADIAFAKI
ncbi:MAG: hypothetical protein WA214_11505, partial [Pseudolabrys sp.]